jgi:ferredoxin
MSATETAPELRFRVDASRCIRCGASRSVAPELVHLGSRAAGFAKQPVTPSEFGQARRAAAICPVGAIRESR